MGRIAENLAGQQFGRLVVLKEGGKDSRGKILWLCECQCSGRPQVLVRADRLKSRETTSCGCLRKELWIQSNKSRLVDLAGSVFGELTVIEWFSDGSERGKWKCVCKCGATHLVHSHHLLSGKTTRCTECRKRHQEQVLSKGSGIVKEARVSMGLTQTEFAKKLGLSRKAIVKVEAEGRFFSEYSHGARAQLAFNQVVPKQFRQPRVMLKQIGEKGNRRIIMSRCAYCGKVVEQLAIHARKYVPCCDGRCAALYQHHGPKTVSVNNELSPQVVAEFDETLRPKETRRRMKTESQVIQEVLKG